MRSTIKPIFASMLLMVMIASATADTLDKAIERQDAQLQLDQSRATSMAISVNAASAAGDDIPVLFSIMAMGEQYVLKFTTRGGSYIVTESNRDIGSKWKLVKYDGLSALIQKGSEKPIRVYLSVPDDIEQAQSMTTQSTSPADVVPPTPGATSQ